MPRSLFRWKRASVALALGVALGAWPAGQGASAQPREGGAGFEGQNFLLTATDIDVAVVEGQIESLAARQNVRMEMREDPSSDTLAPAPDKRRPSAAPTADAQDGSILGRDFILNAQSLDLSMGENGQVGELIAETGVTLVMSDLEARGARLIYGGRVRILTIWGAPGVPCVVNRQGTTTTGERFIYNVATGEASIGGAGGSQPVRPTATPTTPQPGLEPRLGPIAAATPVVSTPAPGQPTVSTTETEDFVLRGFDIDIDKDEDLGVTSVRVTGSRDKPASISSKKPPAPPQGGK
jgi:hypothetical protein